jgi:hypothetical protein
MQEIRQARRGHQLTAALPASRDPWTIERTCQQLRRQVAALGLQSEGRPFLRLDGAPALHVVVDRDTPGGPGLRFEETGPQQLIVADDVPLAELAERVRELRQTVLAEMPDAEIGPAEYHAGRAGFHLGSLVIPVAPAREVPVEADERRTLRLLPRFAPAPLLVIAA